MPKEKDKEIKGLKRELGLEFKGISSLHMSPSHPSGIFVASAFCSRPKVPR
jgi:hypothetical protein